MSAVAVAGGRFWVCFVCFPTGARDTFAVESITYFATKFPFVWDLDVTGKGIISYEIVQKSGVIDKNYIFGQSGEF